MNDVSRGRFEARIEIVDGCWLWRGNVDPTYGRGRYAGRWANRVAYEIYTGPIPDGYDVHHVCEQRLCVNPAHLEALSREEHIKRHQTERCIHGHLRTVHGRTRPRGAACCRACERERGRRRRAPTVRDRFHRGCMPEIELIRDFGLAPEGALLLHVDRVAFAADLRRPTGSGTISN